MANGSLITTKGKNILLHRAYTANGSLSSTLYLPPTKFKVCINNGTPLITDTDLDIPVPIENGTTNDDGSNTMTGSSGGDNSTDNTTTYKQGAGNTDVTSQNLIANGTATTKIWTIADLDTDGTDAAADQYTSMWFYIKDATALAKIVSVELKLGSAVGDYYSTTVLVANLVVGWNFISETDVLNTWTETGTVAGDIDTFIIEVVTNNATDTFIAGDVLYDLLRQWEASDLLKIFVLGYPTFNYTNNEATIRCLLSTVEANGFLIDGLGVFNEDTTPLLAGEDTFENESKSLTDEIAFVVVNRIL